MDVSVVVPLYNERDNLAPLHRELDQVLRGLNRSYEILFVDDGSADGSADVLREIKAGDDAHVRVIRLARNTGQTAALACGLHRATGDIVVAIDADGENDPADIPKLIAKLGEGYDLASGWRVARWRDSPVTRRLPSAIANVLISRLTGVVMHDYGCTLKAYRRELAQSLMLYGEMHRFVPAIAAEQGARIVEIEVNFRPRRTGRSKYGPGRIVRTILDLMTVRFLSGYATRPIQVFGLIGLIMGGLGAVWTAILVFEKIVLGQMLGNRPALWLAVLLVVVGVQLVSLGLIGEMLARTYHESQGKPVYVIKEEF
ncbi:MAG TPA: glycosyltransferase family 2 protein [Candidatus Binataceae bacterium]|jgi:glycosyltransferase involved in cell wall biosynthesis|nr:glycosyltransferase family 2 protein [Candidatus Binataceae bacterium]